MDNMTEASNLVMFFLFFTERVIIDEYVLYVFKHFSNTCGEDRILH